MRIGYVLSDSGHLAWTEKCAFDYFEIKGDFLLKLSRDKNLKELLELERVSIEAMTSPLPREFGARVVGEDADHAHALKIFTQMTDLAATLGVQKIVFGSGQARNIPEHFNRAKAYEQLLDFITKAKNICNDRNQMLTIEPLHRGETNLINSCAEAQKVVNAIPEISITADCYHIFTEQLSIKDELNKSKIAHAHTSYLPRGSGIIQEEYQQSFFKKLQTLGCNSVSIEERFDSAISMNEMLLTLRHLSSNAALLTNNWAEGDETTRQ